MTSQTLPWRDAVLSGFRLVARRPAAALSWVAVLIVGGVISTGLRIWVVQGSDGQMDFAAIGLKLAAVGMLLGQLILVVTLAMVLRTEMRPEDPRAAWPRFGGDELRLLALTVPFMLLVLISSAMVVSAGGVFLDDAAPIARRMDLIFRLVTIPLAIVGARLALAPALTVADHRVRLAKSAGLTRGLHMRLALILVTTLVLAGLIEEAARQGRDLLAGALSIHAPRPAQRYPSISEALNASLGPGALLLLAFNAGVQALTFAVSVAPLGYAWRRLTGDLVVDQAAVFD
ncbi:hypothetical protein [Caulobacter soli]|uniref:hypothetical protein n=1 Tax=Caulobacter soli TaxID=2708539 RepID=UPI0013EA00E3|nr:hypothetical protein [Caulobacter soli]